MKRMTLFAAAVLIACGGKDSTAPLVLTNSGNITTSGAQSGTFATTTLTQYYNTSTDTSAFAVTVTQTATVPAVTIGVVWSGAPTVGHYKSSDANGNGAVTLNTTNTTYWAATSVNSDFPQGTYDLNITKVTFATNVSNGKAYTVNGTLDATMPALPGTSATGTITMHMVF